MRTFARSAAHQALLTGAVVLLALVLAVANPTPTRELWLLAGAPLVEELVFRAGLQHALQRRLGHGALSNLGASLAFALLHVVNGAPVALGAATLLPSLVLGAVYQRTRRVWPCIALHAAFNALWLAAGARFPLELLPIA